MINLKWITWIKVISLDANIAKDLIETKLRVFKYLRGIFKIFGIIMEEFQNRIIVDPKILGEKPIIKGTRIPIYIILQMIHDGTTFKEIIEGYPRITIEDIKAVLEYAQY